MVAIACPRCASSDVTHTDGDRYHCRHCETHFVVSKPTAAAPGRRWGKATDLAPAPGAPVGAGGRGAQVALLTSVAMMLAVGLAMVFFVGSRGEQGEPMGPDEPFEGGEALTPPVPVPPPVPPAPAEAAPPPTATLTYTAHGTTSIGGEFWLVTYKNTGSTPIEGPSAVVSLFDAAGKRVDEHAGWATQKMVGPGEHVEILVLAAEPPVHERAEVRHAEPTPASGLSPQIPMTVVEHSERPGTGQHRKIVGTVRNDTDASVQFIEVLVIGRDANGAVVSHATGIATDRTLAPGASTGFAVTTGTFQLALPTSYETRAFAQAG